MDEHEFDRFAKFTVGCDPFDLMAWGRIRKDSKQQFDKLLDPEKLRTAPELGQDVFDAFYKLEPELKKEEQIESEYGFNRSLMEKAMGTMEYAKLRSMTALQDAESAIASQVILEELMKSLPEEDREAVNEYADTTRKLNQAQNQLAGIQGLPKIPRRVQGVLKKLQQQMPGLQKAQQAAQAAFQQAMANPQTRAAIRAALGKAAEELEGINEFGGGWGMETGPLQKVPAKERIELMRRISESQKIKELQKLIGRMKRLAFNKRYTRITREPTEVIDIKRGDDIAHVVSSELGALADPDREDEFYRKYAEKELLVYELQGKETIGRGPIIFLVDNSGSMSGLPELWAKAVGLAMAEIALKDKRTIRWTNFSSRGQSTTHVIEPTLPPAERLAKLVEVAEEFYGSGTDFEEPLSDALDAAEQSAFKKADIVFLTDGIAPLSDEFVKRFREVKEKKGVRLHAVLIGGTDESVKMVADETHDLYDVVAQGDQVAGALFEAL